MHDAVENAAGNSRWILEIQQSERLERRFMKHYRSYSTALACVARLHVISPRTWRADYRNVRRVTSRKQRILLRHHSATGRVRVRALIGYWNIRFRP